MRKMKGRKRGEEKQRNEGHKGIKKRRKGQGRSASLVDVAETNYGYTKEYVKAVYCHPAYLTSMQSTS